MSNPLTQFHAVEMWTNDRQQEFNDSARLADRAPEYGGSWSLKSMKKTAWVLLIVTLVTAALTAGCIVLLANMPAGSILTMVVIIFTCLFVFTAITCAFCDLAIWGYLAFNRIRTNLHKRKAAREKATENSDESAV